MLQNVHPKVTWAISAQNLFTLLKRTAWNFAVGLESEE